MKSKPERSYRQATRLVEAATTLRERDDLGPPDFRDAIAEWLIHCAATTRRMIDSPASLPTLPAVVAILDAIEADR